MAYIGNIPAEKYSAFQKQDFTTSATTSYTLDNPVANANELALFINNVRQEPTTAYSASGTTLTLTEATSSSDDMYCVYLGKAVQTVNPPNASVGTSQLADNGVTTAKIANDAVTKDKVSNLMYPAFEASLSSSQNISDAIVTKVQLDTKVFDTDNCYDNTTNYRFTPNVAGKYFVYAYARVDGSVTNRLLNLISYIYKNGSTYRNTRHNFNSSATEHKFTVYNYTTIELNGSSDYVEFFFYGDTSSGFPIIHQGNTFFGAYRIGD